jgi:hypothetical protein
MSMKRCAMTSLALLVLIPALFPAQSKPVPNSAAAAARPAKDTKLDLAINFDFSGLALHSGDAAKDDALKNRCDTFAKLIREQVYPLLREITGLSLGKYYKEIRIQIVPNGGMNVKGAGGIASRNQIRLEQRYSVDRTPHPFDSHELIHVFNGCCGALSGFGDHTWHAALMNVVQVRMGWGTAFRRGDSVENLTRLCEKIEESPDGPKAFEYRSAILGEELNIAYYDLGEDAVSRLYRSNMKPRLIEKPSRGITAVWGRSADQVLALVTDLERDYKFTFDERIRKALGL